jgi:ankyrin repeat protein
MALARVDFLGRNIPELCLAAEHGYTQVARALLAEGDADPNVQNREGQTALFIASKQGHHEMVQFLLSAGASVVSDFDRHNPPNQFHPTPVQIAARHVHMNVVATLIAAGADRTRLWLEFPAGCKQCGCPCEWDYPTRARGLGERVCFCDLCQSTGCTFDPTTVPIAGLVRLDTSSNPIPELYLAAEHGFADVVEVLLALGANPSAGRSDMPDSSPMVVAATHGHEEVLAILARSNKLAHPDHQFEAATHERVLVAARLIAIEHGHAGCAQQLAEELAVLQHQTRVQDVHNQRLTVRRSHVMRATNMATDAAEVARYAAYVLCPQVL